MFKISSKVVFFLSVVAVFCAINAAPKRKKRLNKKAQKLALAKSIQEAAANPSAQYNYLFGSDYAVVNLSSPQAALAIVKKILPNNPVILEAGAYDGTDAENLGKIWPEGMVYSFEPIPELFEKALRKVVCLSNVHLYNYALGDYIGTAEMHVSEEPSDPGVVSQSSSLLAPKDHLIYSGTKFLRTLNVPVITIDAWAAAHNIDHIDFLWLDMQGYELPAIMASPKIFKTVKAVLLEVEFVEAYAGQYLFEDIKKWFEAQGFELFGLATGCQWFGDALFIRKS